jgi:hypothetical protein
MVLRKSNRTYLQKRKLQRIGQSTGPRRSRRGNHSKTSKPLEQFYKIIGPRRRTVKSFDLFWRAATCVDGGAFNLAPSGMGATRPTAQQVQTALDF